MGTNLWLILLSLIFILSFIFNQLQRKYQISSVILLLLLGIFLKLFVGVSGLNISLPDETLKVFGTLGLLVIVLEAVMDTEVNRRNIKFLGSSFFFASVVVIASMLAIALLFKQVYGLSVVQGLIYATPLAIVSSAIVIPSVSAVDGRLKDFLVMESVFSDIVGVLAFNFLVSVELNSLVSVSTFLFEIVLMIIISVVTTFFLSILMSQEKTKNIQIVVLAMLILIYAVTEIFHLSALLLILIFGLSLRNLPRLIIDKYRDNKLMGYLQEDMINSNLHSMQELIDELGFIIRSIFFVLLGYSLNLVELINIKVILMGLTIIFSLYCLRYLLLHVMTRNKYERLVAVSMAPRGLITVLLFFQIPSKFIYPEFDNSITFIIIIFSGIIMSAGLMFAKKYKEKPVV